MHSLGNVAPKSQEEPEPGPETLVEPLSLSRPCPSVQASFPLPIQLAEEYFSISH